MTGNMNLNRAALPFIYDEGLYSVRSGAVPYTGNSAFGVWILHPGRLTDGEHQLLTKILQSVGLETGEVTMADLSAFPADSSLESILKLKPGRILAFTGEAVLDRKFELYRIADLEPAKILCAHSLDELGGNTEFKKMFWHSLKQLFEIA